MKDADTQADPSLLQQAYLHSSPLSGGCLMPPEAQCAYRSQAKGAPPCN